MMMANKLSDNKIKLLQDRQFLQDEIIKLLDENNSKISNKIFSLFYKISLKDEESKVVKSNIISNISFLILLFVLIEEPLNNIINALDKGGNWTITGLDDRKNMVKFNNETIRQQLDCLIILLNDILSELPLHDLKKLKNSLI